MLRLGVDHPLIQVVEWTPWQLQVIAGQQLLLPVGVVEGRGKWRGGGSGENQGEIIIVSLSH